MSKQLLPAVAYLRVSSKGQIDGDGFPRQRDTIARYAKAHGVELVGEYRDEGVSGTASLAERPGLLDLVARLASNGVRVAIVEKADRLARDLIEGELILREMRRLGVRVIEAEGGNDITAGDESNPTAVLVRQILGAVAQFEKTALVLKLRASRVRIRRQTGRCEGRKGFGDRDGEQATLEVMRQLRRKPRNGERPTFADVARELNKRGCATRTGKPWSREVVRQILVRAK